MNTLYYELIFLGGYVVGTLVTSATSLLLALSDYKRGKAIDAEISKGKIMANIVRDFQRED